MDTPASSLEVKISHVMEKKAKKIFELFNCFEESSSGSSTLSGRLASSSEESFQSSPSPHKLPPRSREEFYKRVSTFEPGLWSVDEISPLICASMGWRLFQKNVLECVSCHEVICAFLPNKKDKDAYEKFLCNLEYRIDTNHKDACGWLYNQCPSEFSNPLAINGEDIRNMKNSVQTLASLNSALPFLNKTRLSAILAVDEEIIKGLLKSDEIDNDIKVTAVLLVLCGWSKGEGAFLRCNVCRRLVGLWSMISIADELKKKDDSKTTSDDTSSRKRKLSESSESTLEVEETKRVTRQSPRKNKNVEPADAPTPKRMKTRSQDDKMEEESPNKEPVAAEKMECLLITSPTTQVQKIEKTYFTPLDEHRHWCPWIKKVDDLDDLESEEEEDPPLGACKVVDRVRMHLQFFEQRKSLTCKSNIQNVEGLRIIRSLLDEVSSD